MREILFRGKRCDNGEWVYGDLVHWWGRHNTKPDIQIYNNVHRVNVIPESVSEFTGLTDKNGKKIFEGDIVKILSKHLDCVIWSSGCFCMERQTFHYEMTYQNGLHMEVIGNIHDNKLEDFENGERMQNEDTE